jgi:hypothetical protein
VVKEHQRRYHRKIVPFDTTTLEGSQPAVVMSRYARSITHSGGIHCATREASCQKGVSMEDYFLRWRILARMRRFLRPCFRRPFPDLFVPKAISKFLNELTERVSDNP